MVYGRGFGLVHKNGVLGWDFDWSEGSGSLACALPFEIWIDGWVCSVYTFVVGLKLHEYGVWRERESKILDSFVE